LLNAEVSSWIEVLIREESTLLLKTSGVDSILDVVDMLPVTMVASEQTGLSPEHVTNVIKVFYSSVFTTAGIFVSIEALTDAELQSQCRTRLANEIFGHFVKVSSFLLLFFTTWYLCCFLVAKICSESGE
jgi:hypothetical protein